jgi:N-acetylglucosaminyldiphosphoundecaprenol N-acetyl-beta-D-mannosaminyltransferase
MSMHAIHAPRGAFKVLGVRVDAVQIPEVISQMVEWIEKRQTRNFIAVTGMHGIMEAQHSDEFKTILNSASLVVADGMPLVWVGRARRFPMHRRVYGPELMETFCQVTAGRYRHFFYGGAHGVADELGKVLQRRFGIQVAGSYCPPFRPLLPDEERSVLERVRASGADILWVGLSTPKQESWMSKYRDRMEVPVLVGVGAAFDFFTGRTSQAPVWMREHGFEWLFRLLTEPRRLWRRYVIYGSQFVWNVTLELAGVKRFL